MHEENDLFFQSSPEQRQANSQEQLDQDRSNSNNVATPISSHAELPLARHRRDPAMKSGKLFCSDGVQVFEGLAPK